MRSLVAVSPSALPLSARFAVWLTAWLAGAASTDDARDAIVGGLAAGSWRRLLRKTLPRVARALTALDG